uniref:Uncharacterized protein n=1 Tax=Oryza barthii TaxID=65489 RepID=A0A0D3HFF9_9ORYZ
MSGRTDDGHTHVGEERLWRSIKTRALFGWKRKLGTVLGGYLDKWVIDSTVAEALLNKRWIQDITGALGMQAILEYLSLWPVMKSIQLSDQEDSLHWRWETSGEYSSRSAYQAQFLGRIRFQSSPI